MFIEKWELFSEEEREREFQELMHSSYWQYLPLQTQLKLKRLLQPEAPEPEPENEVRADHLPLMS